MFGDLRWDLDQDFDTDESVPIADSAILAVRRDLAAIALVDQALALSTEAAIAMSLAVEMDYPNSATSKSMCAKALNDTMDKLRELAPPPVEEDELDDLKARRAKRLEGIAAASH